MENRIMGVFPALLNQPCWRMPRVLNESISIDIAVLVDPIERALNIRPDLLDEGKITGAPVVRAGEHDKQRRGIDTAVIPAERNLTCGRQFSFSRFMQDLARFCVLRRN